MNKNVFSETPVLNVTNGNYRQTTLGGAFRSRTFKMLLDQYLDTGYFLSNAGEITCSGGFVKLSNGKYVVATSSADADGMVCVSDLSDNNNFVGKPFVVANKFQNGQAVKVMKINNAAPIDPFIFCSGAKKGNKISLVSGDLQCKVAATGETAFAVALQDADTNGVVPVSFINKEVVS